MNTLDYRQYTAQLFKKKNLFPNQANYDTCLDKIMISGELELNSLLPNLPADWMKKTLISVNWTKQDLIRILGFGSSFTGYLIAPVQTRSLQTSKPKHLGSVVNLIVSLYDQLIDTGSAPEHILPEDYIELLSNSNKLPKEIPPLLTDVVFILVNYYFSSLLKSSIYGKDKYVLKTILSAIKKMHHAENLTLEKDANEETMLDKSRLPFLVMGLTVWLYKPNRANITYEEHYSWLIEIGEFIGWLDDICDYHNDLDLAHPNLLKLAFEQEKNSKTVIHKLTDNYIKVSSFWNTKVGRISTMPFQDIRAFQTMSCAWLGGVTERQTPLYA